MRFVKNLIPALIAIGIVFAILFAANELKYKQLDAQTKKVIPPKPIDAVTVIRSSGQRELRLTGVSRAVQRARLSFLVSGSLSNRPVELGSPVVKGQLLAQLHNPQLEPAVAAAKAQVRELSTRVAQANRELNRVVRLRRSKAATREELDAVRAQRDALVASKATASAKLSEAEQLLNETSLTAPFDGVVEQVVVEPGEFVSPGRPVLTIAGVVQQEVEFDLPEQLLGSVKQGQEVTLRFPNLQGDRQTTTAVIHRIGSSGLGQGRLFPVLARFKADGLPAGISVEWQLFEQKSAQLLIPIRAVINPGGINHRVFRVQTKENQSKVESVSIITGELISGKVAVEGVREGDLVVVSGHSLLLDGQSIKLRQIDGVAAKPDTGAPITPKPVAEAPVAKQPAEPVSGE